MSELAAITMEQLLALETGKTYAVKVRDIDGVRPEARGASYPIVFEKIAPDPDTNMGPITNPSLVMVCGRGSVDDHIVYRFHGWLIEAIEAMS